jgi:hypothetical protein
VLLHDGVHGMYRCSTFAAAAVHVAVVASLALVGCRVPRPLLWALLLLPLCGQLCGQLLSLA